jgi:LPS export ABC transporter protein LptC
MEMNLFPAPSPGASRLARLTLIGLLTAVWWVGLLGGCEEHAAEQSAPAAVNLPDNILSDFSMDMTRGELKSAVFKAARAVMYRKRDSMVVDDLEARLFDSDGSPSSTLWADSGLIRERKKEMIANGNVRVLSRDSVYLTSDSLFWYGELQAPDTTQSSRRRAGQPPPQRYMVAKTNVHLVTRDSVQLWTDTLLWNDLSKTVATDAFVTIVRRGEDTLRGQGLRSDDELSRITIQESASGRLQRQPR